MDLINKKCIPCEGGVLPFTKSEAEKLLPILNSEQVTTGAVIIHFARTYFERN